MLFVLTFVAHRPHCHFGSIRLRPHSPSILAIPFGFIWQAIEWKRNKHIENETKLDQTYVHLFSFQTFCVCEEINPLKRIPMMPLNGIVSCAMNSSEQKEEIVWNGTLQQSPGLTRNKSNCAQPKLPNVSSLDENKCDFANETQCDFQLNRLLFGRSQPLRRKFEHWVDFYFWETFSTHWHILLYSVVSIIQRHSSISRGHE